MAQYADETLPGLSLLLAQSSAQIGEEYQGMKLSRLVKSRAAYFPATRSAGESDIQEARFLPLERLRQPKLAGASAG